MTPRKLTGNFVETDVDDETLIVDMDGGLLFSLSGTGLAVWQAIDGRRDSGAIAIRMAEAFSGELKTIASDVDALLGDFARARLVTL